MKGYIAAKLREGRFSTPSEYIRSLIRDDQDLAGRATPAPFARRAAQLQQPRMEVNSRLKEVDAFLVTLNDAQQARENTGQGDFVLAAIIDMIYRNRCG